MSMLNQVDTNELALRTIDQVPCEAALMECGRLIHAAVISRRFMNTLLTNPIKSIEDGFCGEKFAFTREEKQQIKHIHASSLAEFSNQLVQAMQNSCCISPASEIAYVRVERRK